MNFDTSLTVQEEKHLNELVANAERNKAEAQKLALDAGKLLTITADRFNEYKDKGFFKRCWYTISGKRGELERANKHDLIEMQKFAWAYLSKLQEQNLIQAQAIAVIRNNLKALQGSISTIHDIIKTLIKKFDARITKLEEVTSLLDWCNNIQAQKDYGGINLKPPVFSRR
jgi:dephospho-CoA kinase